MHRCCQQSAFLHGFGIGDRQNARQTGTDWANIGVGLSFPAVGLAAAKYFALGVELDMGFKPNDYFVVFHRFASKASRTRGLSFRQEASCVACSKP